MSPTWYTSGAPFAIPVAILFSFLVSSLHATWKGRPSKAQQRALSQKTWLSFVVLINLTYAVESAKILISVALNSHYTVSREISLHTLSSLLLWTMFLLPGINAQQFSWRPYYTPWTFCLAYEYWKFQRIHGANQSDMHTVLSIFRVAILSLSLATCLLSIGPNLQRDSPLTALQNLQKENLPGDRIEKILSSESIETPSTDDTIETKVDQSNVTNSKGLFLALWDLRIFVPYIKPSKSHRWELKVPGLLVCVVVTGLANAYAPYQLSVLLRSLEFEKRIPINGILLYGFSYLCSSNSGMAMLKTRLSNSLEEGSTTCLKNASFTHLMSLSSDFHDSKISSELYSVVDHAESVVRIFSLSGVTAVPMVVDLLLACSYLVYLFGPYMGLIIAYTATLFIYVAHVTVSGRDKALEDHSKASEAESQILLESTGNFQTITYFNRFTYEKNRYSEAMKKARAAFKDVEWCFDGVYVARKAVMDLGKCVALVFAAYGVQHGNHTFGDFFMLFTYWNTISRSIEYVYDVLDGLYRDASSAKQLVRLFKLEPSVKDGTRVLDLVRGEIEFCQANFSYDGMRSVVKDLSFNIEPGQTVALVGESGAGKSTILKLLFRMYNLEGGSILIDKQDTRDLTLKSLREAIGFVPQSASLFNESIMYNVRYARLDATDEEVMEACKAAAIHDQIISYTDGYNTKVGERGMKLSGGELQRISIARTILKNPKIVLLDEATSSVDSLTEGKIQRALKTLTKSRTTFIIAHRLSTVKEANRILVIKGGNIIEQGPPEELLRAKGAYYDLWSEQVGLFHSEDTEAVKK